MVPIEDALKGATSAEKSGTSQQNAKPKKTTSAITAASQDIFQGTVVLHDWTSATAAANQVTLLGTAQMLMLSL